MSFEDNVYIALVDGEEGFCALLCTEEWESREAREVDNLFVDKIGCDSGFGDKKLRRRA